MRLLFALSTAFVFAHASAQQSMCLYERAMTWISTSPEVRRQVQEHLGLQLSEGDARIHFAVCDSLFPSDIFLIQDVFDTATCALITSKDELNRLAGSKKTSAPSPEEITHYAPFDRYWNEMDSLLLMFQYVESRQVRAMLCRRTPQTSSTVVAVDTTQPGIRFAWHPRGRPYDWIFGSIDISLCFDANGEVCNYVLHRIES